MVGKTVRLHADCATSAKLYLDASQLSVVPNLICGAGIELNRQVLLRRARCGYNPNAGLPQGPVCIKQSRRANYFRRRRLCSLSFQQSRRLRSVDPEVVEIILGFTALLLFALVMLIALSVSGEAMPSNNPHHGSETEKKMRRRASATPSRPHPSQVQIEGSSQSQPCSSDRRRR